ncbi:MAG: hypothetical protein WKF77_10265 [Planctomycetaceae bacterium]
MLPVAINEVEEGNCVILQPQSGKEPRFIAHLAPKDWFRLVEQLNKKKSSLNALPVAPAENVQNSRESEASTAVFDVALSTSARLTELAGCWLGSLPASANAACARQQRSPKDHTGANECSARKKTSRGNSSNR